MTSHTALGIFITNPRNLKTDVPAAARTAEQLKDTLSNVIEIMFHMLPQGQNLFYKDNLELLANVFAKFAVETIAKDRLNAHEAAWAKVFLLYLTPTGMDNAFTKFLDEKGIDCKRFQPDEAPQIVCNIAGNNYFAKAFVEAFDEYMSQDNPQISRETFETLNRLVEEDRIRLHIPPRAVSAVIEEEFVGLNQDRPQTAAQIEENQPASPAPRRSSSTIVRTPAPVINGSDCLTSHISLINRSNSPQSLARN